MKYGKFITGALVVLVLGTDGVMLAAEHYTNKKAESTKVHHPKTKIITSSSSSSSSASSSTEQASSATVMTPQYTYEPAVATSADRARIRCRH